MANEATTTQHTITTSQPQPAGEHIMQFFGYAHLPADLQDVSKPFSELAHYLISRLKRNPERTTMLRKLLEAKDCAVRALIAKDVA